MSPDRVVPRKIFASAMLLTLAGWLLLLLEEEHLHTHKIELRLGRIGGLLLYPSYPTGGRPVVTRPVQGRRQNLPATFASETCRQILPPTLDMSGYNRSSTSRVGRV